MSKDLWENERNNYNSLTDIPESEFISCNDEYIICNYKKIAFKRTDIRRISRGEYPTNKGKVWETLILKLNDGRKIELIAGEVTQYADGLLSIRTECFVSDDGKKIKEAVSKKYLPKLSALLAIFFMGAWLIGGYRIIYVPTSSMYPTIEDPCALISRKIQENEEIERFECITFDGEDGKILVKRVIGLPGDTIKIKKSNIYINGDLINEPYIYYNCDMYPEADEISFSVPENSYFVMGDNREGSFDSRYFEMPYISRGKIHNKVITAFTPYYASKYINYYKYRSQK